jgi:hypothetical protein
MVKKRKGKTKLDRTVETVSEGTVELLKYNSRFLHRATAEDIEFEREQLEAMHECKLEPYRVTHDTMSGTPMTVVEWRIL